ncbi:hypothetical protein LQF12_07990 [Ruania suaedae]|uniref:hypothetical protein n=1 Tax=Ruania suaedae TaxID=2897774 RepID=UPI001E36ACF2|nr:hypothetical protein [Ruania suaedae]UFU04497.1 hypothetical protein LQF12_07990 [Ruania suaedae]
MFPIGSAPLPTASAEFDARLCAGLVETLRPDAGVPQVASVLAADGRILSLDLGLTGLELRARGLRTSRPASLESTGELLSHTDDVVVRARPIVVDGVPVHAEARVQGLVLGYRRDPDGQWWLGAEQPAAGALSGRARLQTDLDTLEVGALALLGERVAASGFTLTGAHLTATCPDPRRVQIEVEATIRRGPLRAVIIGSGSAAVGTDMVLRLSDLAVRSPSPLVAMALGTVRARLAPWEGHEIDLSALTFGSVGDVALAVQGRSMVLEADLGR